MSYSKLRYIDFARNFILANLTAPKNGTNIDLVVLKYFNVDFKKVGVGQNYAVMESMNNFVILRVKFLESTQIV